MSQGPSDWREIVGIVGDMKQYGLGERTPVQVIRAVPAASVFLELHARRAYWRGRSTARWSPGLRGIVRVARSPAAALAGAHARRRRERVDSSAAVLSDADRAVWRRGADAGGNRRLWRDVVHRAGCRTQELAIRIAHGATWSDILVAGPARRGRHGRVGHRHRAWSAHGCFVRPSRSCSSASTPDDGATYALAATLLTLVAMTASVIPALRATRVDPLVALRER